MASRLVGAVFPDISSAEGLTQSGTHRRLKFSIAPLQVPPEPTADVTTTAASAPAHRRKNPTSLVTDDRRRIFYRQQLQYLLDLAAS
jgi:hypothetical protein